ncbi:hypothetical protein MMC22_010108 [Lobaria immixta]|nr:hypothetical protein [Lobaria immixta]
MLEFPNAQLADENLVPLPAVGPRCANHSDSPYPYPLTGTAGGPTAVLTGSDIFPTVFPTGPIGTGSLPAGSNTTAEPKGPSGSSVASASTLTVLINSTKTGFIIGASSGFVPLPTSNASTGGIIDPSSGSSLPVSYPSILNLTGTSLTGTAIRPTAPLFTPGTIGTSVGPRGTGTGESGSTPSPGPFGNSSFLEPLPTGGVTGTTVSSNDIYSYLSPLISSVIGGASITSIDPSSFVASANSSVASVASALSDSFTLTSTIDSFPSAGPSIPSIPLVPYYPYAPLTSGTIASGTSPVSSSGTGVPNTSTGIGSPFTTTSASATATSSLPGVPSVSDPNSLPATPTFPTLQSGSSGFGPVGTASPFPSGIGGSSPIPTTFDTSIRGTGTISQNIIPTEYFYHHRRPEGYGSADSYGYDYDFDSEDDYAYE